MSRKCGRNSGSPASDALNMRDQSHDFSERPYSTRAPRNFDGENGESWASSVFLPPPNPIRWLFGIGALFSPFVVMVLFIIATREWIIVDTLWYYLGGASVWLPACITFGSCRFLAFRVH